MRATNTLKRNEFVISEETYNNLSKSKHDGLNYLTHCRFILCIKNCSGSHSYEVSSQKYNIFTIIKKSGC